MAHRSVFPCCTVLASTLTLAACGVSDEAPPSEPVTGAAAERFSTAPGEPNHEEITAAGLGFLRAEIVTALQAANVATDVEFFLVNANHFDDCNFSGGAQVVSDSQAEAVAALEPALASPTTDALAIRAFARSLHALQDFYAHTNWIELGGQVLVDASLTAFPALTPYQTVPSSGFVIVQGAKPKRAALTRDEAAAYPESAVVGVRLHKQPPALGLISGTVDYEEGNYCPDAVAMTHEELNKDKASNVGRTAQYEAAKALAILQTEHEWCRLLELTRSAWGDAGVARLSTWVEPGATVPSCAAP